MSNFLLCTDSGSDLMLDACKKYDIIPLKMHYSIGNEVFTDGMTIETVQELYGKMVDGAVPKTSQINASEFVDFWTPLLSENLPILHLSLGSGISGTYSNAEIAKQMILEEHPDAEIYLVDSLGASASYGMLCVEVAKLRAEGKDVKQCYDWLMEVRHNVDVFYTTGDLKYLHRGGRVSKTTAIVGSVLNIKPILHVDEEGHLIPIKKCRGKNAVMKAMLDTMAENVLDGLEYAEKCFISHAAREEEAKQVAAEIEKTYPHLDGKVQIESIGPIIGCHTGPGTVALFFWGKSRKK